MLHGHHRRTIELAQNLQSRIGILYIIVRQLLTMQLFGPSHGKALLLAGIESGILMRVLAITQRLLLGKGKRQILRIFLTSFFSQVSGDVGIVSSRMTEHLSSQTTAGFQRGVAVGFQLVQHGLVVSVIDHHGHKSVVLGRTAQHGRTSDIDILNGIFKRSSLFLNGLLKRIEIHHHHVNGGNTIGLHLTHMLGISAHGKQTTMHFRVQGLHTAVHDFRKASHFADTDGGNTRGLQRLAGTTRRDNFVT